LPFRIIPNKMKKLEHCSIKARGIKDYENDKLTY